MKNKAAWKDSVSGILRRFFLPELNRKYLIRLIAVVAVVTVLMWVFQPCFISGSSMEPCYHDGGFTFNFRWRYTFFPPEKGDVVVISYFGRRKLLKRVVALAGDTVEFRDGKLLVNGVIQSENYVKLPCKWNIPKVKVRSGFCYVVGDNRSQDHLEHKFGEVNLKRITGGPLF